MQKRLSFSKIISTFSTLLLVGLAFLSAFSFFHNNSINNLSISNIQPEVNAAPIDITGFSIYSVAIDENGDGYADRLFSYEVGERMPIVYKTNFVFSHWDSTDGEFVNLEAGFRLLEVHDKKIFTANYFSEGTVIEETEYTIIFDMYEGEDIVATVSCIEDVINPEHTVEEGYNFYWEAGTVDNNGTLTITEMRKANIYEIVFDGNGATYGQMPNQEIAYLQTALLAENEYEREGFTFFGWSLSKTGGNVDFNDKNEYTMCLNGVTLYAVWGVGITYDENGGSEVPDEIGAYGDVITAPISQKENYIFKGWYLEEYENNGTGVKFANALDNILLDKSYVLYAKWEAVNFEIAFDKNNNLATGEMSNQVVGFEQMASLTGNSFNVEGKMFGGWSTTAEGEIEYYNNDLFIMTCEGTTLYAIWVEPIIVLVEGDTVVALNNQEIEYGKDITYVINVPEGKEIESITIDGEVITDAEIITSYYYYGVVFEGIVEDHIISVTLADAPATAFVNKRNALFIILSIMLVVVSGALLLTYVRLSHRKKLALQMANMILEENEKL